MEFDIRLKRAYDPPSEEDGTRVLIERLWPRGVSKREVALDYWIKNIAPSSDLRKWFSHDDTRWEEFKSRYFKELDSSDSVEELLDLLEKGRVTFVYAARDEEHNSAVALKEYMIKLGK